MVAGGIPYPLASDADGQVGRDYGVYDENIKMNLRGRFLIDPDGIIQSIEILHAPVGRNVEEWLRQVQAFQHVRASKGTEATPAGWTPGAQTLTPGPDLVGEVCNVWKP